MKRKWPQKCGHLFYSLVLFTDRMVTNCPIQLHKRLYLILAILSSLPYKRSNLAAPLVSSQRVIPRDTSPSSPALRPRYTSVENQFLVK